MLPSLTPLGVLAPLELELVLALEFCVWPLLSVCICPTNSKIAATRLLISFKLVRAGCVFALELRPLSPPLAPVGDPPIPLTSCDASLAGVPSSPLSLVYWFLPNLPRLGAGLPVFRLWFDRFKGGVSAFILPLASATFDGERSGVGGGESTFVSHPSATIGEMSLTFSSSPFRSSSPLVCRFYTLRKHLLLLLCS
ncbi:hypothetical protein EDD37DRAFT_458400 [Exophiala viscosa]|uniref:uncharacterized protein n=1 Tax=Exophiala viscosa TaxID=2486360 RepID=UPI002199BD86|nr:hypothetical protein EDD37DRAFT_458400 [Exophiala viscosa]